MKVQSVPGQIFCSIFIKKKQPIIGRSFVDNTVSFFEVIESLKHDLIKNRDDIA